MIYLERDGLEAYLEATKSLHNNLGYARFVELSDKKWPIMAIAGEFNVGRGVIWKWKRKLKTEAENGLNV